MRCTRKPMVRGRKPTSPSRRTRLSASLIKAVVHIVDMLEPVHRHRHALPSQGREGNLSACDVALAGYLDEPRAMRTRLREVEAHERTEVTARPGPGGRGQPLDRGLVDVPQQPGAVAGIVQLGLPDGCVVVRRARPDPRAAGRSWEPAARAAARGCFRSSATGLWRTRPSPKDQPTTWATGGRSLGIVRASQRPPAPNKVKPSIRAARRGKASTSWLPATAMTSIPASTSRRTHSSSGAMASNLALVLSTTSPAKSTASTRSVTAQSTQRASAAAGVNSRGSTPRSAIPSGTPEQAVPRCTSPIGENGKAVRHSINSSLVDSPTHRLRARPSLIRSDQTSCSFQRWRSGSLDHDERMVRRQFTAIRGLVHRDGMPTRRKQGNDAE